MPKTYKLRTSEAAREGEEEEGGREEQQGAAENREHHFSRAEPGEKREQELACGAAPDLGSLSALQSNSFFCVFLTNQVKNKSFFTLMDTH